MFNMEKDFANWLMREIEERGWTNAELARRAGISAPNVSMVISGQKGIGWEFCLGIARALGYPPEDVLRRAGLLPPIPARVQDEQEMLGIWRTLSDLQRRTILVMMRALAPRRYSLVTDVQPRPFVAEDTVEYQVPDPVESELLEQFRRLPLRKQERVLADVEVMVHNNNVRLIAEEDDGQRSAET